MSTFPDDVGAFFTAYAEYEYGRENIGGDLAQISPAETARQFTQADRFFGGLLSAAEHLDNYAIYILVGEAGTVPSGRASPPRGTSWGRPRGRTAENRPGRG